jgi:hypothetical protein
MVQQYSALQCTTGTCGQLLQHSPYCMIHNVAASNWVQTEHKVWHDAMASQTVSKIFTVNALLNCLISTTHLRIIRNDSFMIHSHCTVLYLTVCTVVYSNTSLQFLFEKLSCRCATTCGAAHHACTVIVTRIFVIQYI